MAKAKFPVTAAVRVLRKEDVAFEPHLYDYVAKGGTKASSAALGLTEHAVIKTLLFENENGSPLVVLMHGDRQVATGELARQAGYKSVRPCAPDVAEKHSGYVVGGTSPFGTKKAMPVFAEASIFELETLCINGGKRGFLVQLTAADLRRVLQPTLVEVAVVSR